MLIVQKHFRHREDDAYSSSITKLTRTQLSITGVRERKTNPLPSKGAVTAIHE
jgi:hypothetical protein